MTVSDLYEYIDLIEYRNSQFETADEKEAFEKIQAEVFEPFSQGDSDKFEKANEDLIKFIIVERKTAFTVGFKTAISLLLSAMS